MLMFKKSMALLAFAGAVLAGGFAGADEIGPLPPLPGDPVGDPLATAFTSFERVAQDQVSTFLVAVVEPTLVGQILTVRFGPMPDLSGEIVASIVLQPGQNMIVVPRSLVPGWYTAELAGRVKNIDEDEPGAT